MNGNKTFMLRFTAARILDQFENLNKYYMEISPMIKSEKQRIFDEDNELQKLLENESDDVKELHSDKYADDWYVIEMVEHTFCNSMTISIYTLIEKYMNEICKSLKDYNNIPITHKDLKGEGIVRAKMYIEKMCGLNFNTTDSAFLSGINAVRNEIAHENGELYNTPFDNIKKIFFISQQTSGCKIKQADDINESGKKITIYQNIQLEFEFIEYCLEQGKTVFKNIFKQLP